MTDAHDPPYLEVTVAASADEVWDALRDPTQIRQWFGWEYDGLDGEIALIFHGDLPEAIELPEGMDTSIEVDDADRSLRTGPHRIVVADEDGRAVVRVTRVMDVGDEGWEAFATMIDQVEEGWITFFQTLAFAAARHPGETRRTAFGMAPALEADLATLVGVPDLDGLSVGDRCAATTLMGDAITGEVWFRSAHQVGLTVEGWGDGLLVVAIDPSGPAMAIASTYGLDPDAHAALEARWAAWWEAQAPDA